MATSEALRGEAYHHGALRQALLDRAAEVIGERGIEGLSLRGLARDLGVSHAAPNRHFRNKEELLAALAADAYERMRRATLGAVDEAETDPWIRLNSMGRGYLKWALEHRVEFAAANHPDVSRFAAAQLPERMAELQATVRAACDAAQADGRHPDVDAKLLTLYTNAVPFGAAALLTQSVFASELADRDIDELVAELIELVVPIRNRVPRGRAKGEREKERGE